MEDKNIYDLDKGMIIPTEMKKAIKGTFEELTNNNMHGEAMLLIAEYFESYLDTVQLKGINATHDKLGFLTPELNNYRQAVWDKMCEALPIKELLN